MTKRFKVPFAVQGDTAQIPDAVQTDGKVSYNQGFGHDYEKAYSDPQAKDIGREQLNGLFKDITEAIGEIQLQGVASHTAGEIYPKGSIVYFGSDLYISNIANNKDVPPKNWASIKNIADDSLKKNSNLSDLKDVVIARKNLGLGDSATLGKTSALGNSEILLLTQKGGNDINTAASNAQRSANTAVTNAKTADGKAVAAQKRADDAFKRVKPITEGGTGAADAANARKNLGIIEGLGHGQKWVDVTNQRTIGSKYTNNTGRPIQLGITFDPEGTKDHYFFIDGISLHPPYDTQLSHIGHVIPAGSTYQLINVTTSKRLLWAELR